MKNMAAMMSSDRQDWETPSWLFSSLNKRYAFTLDPCCSKETAKCPLYFTEEDDGLHRSWQGHRVFMNPPYGREISKWVQKAYLEAQKGGALVVCLLPARTDTNWWQDYCLKADVIFLRGRLKFGDAENSAPFPSAIVTFRGFEHD